jgi:curved DNA-binding protein CbpA
MHDKFNLINPFELLGFDSKNPNISMKELKSTYYQLALICHPDKGGNSDDMLILQNSYLYIKKQIELKDEKDATFDAIEKEFKDFMKEQTMVPPPFSQVYEEAHIWLSDFNKKFENERDVNDQGSLLTNGYGEIMDQSLIYNKDGVKLERDDELIEKPLHEFTSEIIEYTEPRSFNFNQTNGYDINGGKKSDYTQTFGDLTLSDYKKALTSQKIDSLESKIPSNNNDIENNFEKMLQERQEMDLYISKIKYSKIYVSP